MVDSGTPRAAWIPESHNIPFFADGIAGLDILARLRGLLLRLGCLVLLIVKVGLKAERPDHQTAGHNHQSYTRSNPAPRSVTPMRLRRGRIRIDRAQREHPER